MSHYLRNACITGDIEAVKVLLQDADVNQLISTQTPLTIAAENGHLELVKLLMESGASTTIGYPINAAARKGHLDVLKLLLEKGEFIEDYSRPIMTASANNRLEILKFLLDIGPPALVNAKCANTTPLAFASHNGHMEAVKLLLERGADINMPCNSNNHTAVALATMSHRFDIVMLLEEKGALLTESDKATILTDSLTHNRLDVTEWLLKQHPKTVLGHHPCIVQLALHGADCTIPFENKSIWQLCAEEGDEDTHEALLHFWTPKTHVHHQHWVKNAIICTLLVAKHQRWPFDRPLLYYILSLVAYGWYKATL